MSDVKKRISKYKKSEYGHGVYGARSRVLPKYLERMPTTKKGAIDLSEAGYGEEWYTYNEMIYKLQQYSVRDTAANRMKLFRWDNSCRTFSRVLSSAVTGEKIHINSKNKKLVKLLEGFNDDINSQGWSIRKLLRHIFDDNIVHGKSVCTFHYDNDLEYKMNIFRMDVRTLSPIIHDLFGWRKWVQKSQITANLPSSKSSFNSKKFMPITMPSWGKEQQEHWRTVEEIRTVHIPDSDVFVFDLYDDPPISTVLHLILYKRWIQWFMKESNKKYATPTPMVRVGKDEPPVDDPIQYESILTRVGQEAADWKDFDAFAYPWNYEVTMLEAKSSAADMVAELEYIDAQIFLALAGAISIIGGGSGTRTANADIVQATWIRNVKWFRGELATILTKIYRKVLEFNKFPNWEKEEFVVEFEPMKEEENIQIVQAIVLLYNSGLLEDYNEGRRILRTSLGINLPDLEGDPELPPYIEAEIKASAAALRSPSTTTAADTSKSKKKTKPGMPGQTIPKSTAKSQARKSQRMRKAAKVVG